MSELLKAFDSYNEFERNSYFTLIYDALPSSLCLKVPLEETKKNMNKVLELTNLKNHNYELVYKDWDTEDSNNADFAQDYTYQLLYKSTRNKSTIWISLENETLSVDFLYDCTNSELEAWIINLNHKLRQEFGLSRTPTFKVLTKKHSNFHTEDVRTEEIEINLKDNYNDDFKEVCESIQSSISAKNSGLILLYGEPGTGKTTYIKNLITKNHQQSNFIFVQNEFVNNLLDPDFISFLLKQRNSTLIIEDAEKVIKTRESLKGESVVSTILQLTDGLFSDYLNIKIICTFNTNLSKIDTALLRKGRLISMYEFKKLSLKKTNKLLDKLGFESSNKELSLTDIFNNKAKNYSNIKKDEIGF